ncbi:siderophore-interacting protein [Streptomyces sp. Iso 434]|nr:siderophore-interacting protein [Streptomyces sp. EAG2]
MAAPSRGRLPWLIGAATTPRTSTIRLPEICTAARASRTGLQLATDAYARPGAGGFGSALKADPAGVLPPGSRRRGTRRRRLRRCGAGGHRDGVSAPPGAPVRPLPREDPAARTGALAVEAVRAARFPGGRCCYAWVAGEAGLATGVRRHLVGERGVARADVTFRGYFRHGRAAL